MNENVGIVNEKKVLSLYKNLGGERPSSASVSGRRGGREAGEKLLSLRESPTSTYA